jgi:hypothetical protein
MDGELDSSSDGVSTPNIDCQLEVLERPHMCVRTVRP